jgi:hypothetical protein
MEALAIYMGHSVAMQASQLFCWHSCIPGGCGRTCGWVAAHLTHAGLVITWEAYMTPSWRGSWAVFVAGSVSCQGALRTGQAPSAHQAQSKTQHRLLHGARRSLHGCTELHISRFSTFEVSSRPQLPPARSPLILPLAAAMPFSPAVCVHTRTHTHTHTHARTHARTNTHTHTHKCNHTLPNHTVPIPPNRLNPQNSGTPTTAARAIRRSRRRWHSWSASAAPSRAGPRRRRWWRRAAGRQRRAGRRGRPGGADKRELVFAAAVHVDQSGPASGSAQEQSV